MFIIYDGNIVNGMKFIGPFLTHDAAMEYCCGDDIQANIIELTEPREESGSIYDLLKIVGDALDEAANTLSNNDEDKNAQDLAEELTGHAMNCRTATLEYEPE